MSTFDRLIRRTPLRLLAALAVAATPAAVGRAHAAPDRPRCYAFAVSPDFARDGTAFCYRDGFAIHGEPPLVFYVSTDGARTWRQTVAAGIAPSRIAWFDQLVVSPMFAEDHTIYLQSLDGLYQSVDNGETFSLASPFATTRGGRDNLSAYVEDLAGTGLSRHTTIAFSGSPDFPPMRIQPPLHTPVAGSPDGNLRFLLAPAFPADPRAFMLAERRDATTDVVRAVLYSCDTQLTCAQPLHTFPAGQHAWRGWVAPDFATSHRLYVETSADAYGRRWDHLWISTDAGRTFRADPTTVALSGRARAVGGLTVSVDLAYATARRVYLRWTYASGDKRSRAATAPAFQQLLRSENGGVTWATIGYNRYSQAGPRGNLPWTNLAATAHPTILAPTDTTVLVLGGTYTPVYYGPFCSRDAGRTWRATCT